MLGNYKKELHDVNMNLSGVFRISLESYKVQTYLFCVRVDSGVNLALTQRTETGTASCTQLDAETDDKHKLCSDLVSAQAI